MPLRATLQKMDSKPGRPESFKVLTRFVGQTPKLPLVGERFYMNLDPDGDNAPVRFQSSLVTRIISRIKGCIRFETENSVYKLLISE